MLVSGKFIMIPMVIIKIPLGTLGFVGGLKPIILDYESVDLDLMLTESIRHVKMFFLYETVHDDITISFVSAITSASATFELCFRFWPHITNGHGFAFNCRRSNFCLLCSFPFLVLLKYYRQTIDLETEIETAHSRTIGCFCNHDSVWSFGVGVFELSIVIDASSLLKLTLFINTCT